MKILSWNVNDFRGGADLSLVEYLRPDVVLLQGADLQSGKVPDVLQKLNYKTATNLPQNSGRNTGTMTSTRVKEKEFDFLRGVDEKKEGRLLATFSQGVKIINLSAEIGKVNTKAQKDKMEFYNRFLDYLEEAVKGGTSIVVGGDFQISCSGADLMNPSVNGRYSGFLQEEVEIMDRLVSMGFVDVYAHFNPERERSFTFWPDRMDARRKNKGWRFDHFFVSRDLIDKVSSCEHLVDVYGSNHCPILINIEL